VTKTRCSAQGSLNHRSIGSTQKALILGVILSPITFFWTSPNYVWLALGFQLIVLTYFWTLRFDIVANLVYWPLCLIGLVTLPRELSATVPLVIYLFAYALYFRHYEGCRWLHLGRFTKVIATYTVLTVTISTAALVIWAAKSHPDLSNVTQAVSGRSVWSLIAAGALFSIANSVGEEFIFRGIAWNGFELVCMNRWSLSVSQAAYFGIMHFQGVPGGWVGVSMATIYGLALGEIKHRSGGFLAPIVTHTFADATVFILLYRASIGLT
jgi:membrane protease YdiL (CAAX protease family)